MNRAEKRLYRFVNTVVRFILRSRVHALLSERVVLLCIEGRKSGRKYAVPVSYILDTEGVVCFTGRYWSAWWKNLAGGAPAVVRLRGRDVEAVAEIVTDKDEAARGLAAFLSGHPGTAGRYGVTLDAEGRPDTGEVERAARDEAVMVRARAIRDGTGRASGIKTSGRNFSSRGA